MPDSVVTSHPTAREPSFGNGGLAERRQLSVMFCDLVGSTALSRVLDPEDLRDVLHAYQAIAGDAIERYGGAITRFMGDGILALFGYPMAHEDATERAVHAAVAIVEAIAELDASARFGPQVSLKVRIGVATGLTVVGDIIGKGAAREEAVIGETPNLAARLQGLAAANEIMIALETRTLIGERFECEPVGERALKGFADPVEVWRVLGARDPLSLMDAAESSDAQPMVNRERERALLTRLWQHSHTGRGQIALVTGEPGIGKSRLIRTLRSLVIEQRGSWLRLQCLPYFANTSLYPIANRLAQLAGFEREDSDGVRIEKLESTFSQLLANASSAWLDAFADVLEIEHASPAPKDGPEMTAQRRKERMLDALAEFVVLMSQRRPMVVVLEDAHWMDPTTGELLARVAQAIETSRILIVVSHRPGIQLELPGTVDITQLELTRLHPLEGRAILESMLGGQKLDEQVINAIVERTDGVPLFVEEVTRAVIDSDVEAGSDVNVAAIPSSLKDSLMARIDRLGSAKPLAQLASVIGHQVTRALLAEVSGMEARRLDAELKHLCDADILAPLVSDNDEEYGFRHALVRDAAYESQLRRRRETVHARVADVLVEKFSDLVAHRPELVAEHFTRSKRFQEAGERWIEAGRRAGERSANREAVNHLRRGLDVLSGISDSRKRDRLELALLNVLGPALIATDGPGSPSVSDIYERALAVCHRVPESQQHFVALWGWWRVSMNHDIGRARAERLETLAERLNDPGLALQAHHCQWATAFHLGEHAACAAHVQAGLALYDEHAHCHQASEYGGHDARVCGEGEQALSLWIMGREQDGRAPIERAQEWARQLNHVGSIAHAMDYAVIHALYRRDAQAVMQLAGVLKEFAEEQRLPDYSSRAAFFDGWARASSGDLHDGLVCMQRAVAALAQTGTREDFPMFYELMVQVMTRLGHYQEAIRTLLLAFRESKRTGIRFWLAEQHRCRAEIALASGNCGAEQALAQALSVANRQGARAFCLRAATTLARVFERSNRRVEAVATLEQHLAPYSPDCTTRDVSEARALRDQLSAP